MLNALSRIPTQLQKPVARGMLAVAGAATLAGALSLLILTDPPEQKCKGHLWAKECVDIPRDSTPYVVTALVLFAIAAFCLLAALKLVTTQGRLKKYLPILKGIETMNIQQIVDITGSSRATVYRDLQTLINGHMIDDLYVDYGNERVVSKRYIPDASRKTVVKCTGCSANNEIILGITKNCSHCGQPLLLDPRGQF